MQVSGGLKARAQGGGVGANLVKEGPQTCYPFLFLDQGKQLVGGNATAIAAARGSEVGAVGALFKPIGEMGVPRIPISSVEMGEVKVRQLDVVWIRLPVEEGIVDAKLEPLDPRAHENLTCDMTEEPTFEVLAESGVKRCYSLFTLFALWNEGFERRFCLWITPGKQLHWPHTGALGVLRQRREVGSDLAICH